ncbi:MAG: amidohydrolase family protein [Acidimicrobiia bacterium]|nr:amidohydrolase family protein [Acidimicrobiia bacterium]
MSDTTPGLVCGHHHLYSSLARGMPAPPATPTDFLSILRQVWWRLDAALDLDLVHHSAMLGALEALQCGTTAIVDHHESPNAIEGSLSVIGEACAAVGVRVVCCYGVTDRWSDDGTLVAGDWSSPPPAMTSAARRGLDECARHARAGGRTMVGLHAAFTCSDETIEAAADLARELDLGVHVHVAEGAVDRAAADRLARHADERWLSAHCVHLLADRTLAGTIAHNPRSNLNNAVGYAAPARRPNPVVLGSDGIGADMLEEFRLAYVAQRADDVTATPETAWSWLEAGWTLVPEARDDRVRWSYEHVDSPWHAAFTPGVRALDVVGAGGEVLLRDGVPTRVDAAEIRAKAAEAAARLFARL